MPHKPNAIDITGNVYGRLTVERRDPSPTTNRDSRKRAYWLCRCECGSIVSIIGKHLRNGNTRSCGCLHDDVCREKATKHLQVNTGAYRSWAMAKTRCTNRKVRTWPYSGGRGITMCPEWTADFRAFLRDMGPRPSGHTLDRIDSNGPYAPENCRWADLRTQAMNRRNNRPITFNGRTELIAEWERILGFKEGKLKRRLQRGWTVERALTAPQFHRLSRKEGH